MTRASPELEQFIDESIERSRAKGYFPTEFEGMRKRWGTREAIRRLVISGEIQSGFKRMLSLGLRDWTVEAAVEQFPHEFDKGAREAAEWRLTEASKANV